MSYKRIFAIVCISVFLCIKLSESTAQKSPLTKSTSQLLRLHPFLKHNQLSKDMRSLLANLANRKKRKAHLHKRRNTHNWHFLRNALQIKSNKKQIFDVNDGESPIFKRSEKTLFGDRFKFENFASPHLKLIRRDATTCASVDSSRMFDTFKEVLKEVEKVAKDKLIKKTKKDCDLNGSWMSEAGGAHLDITEDNKNLAVKIGEVVRNQGFLTDTQWTFKGSVALDKIVSINGVNEQCKRVATFIGDCKSYDENVEIIWGHWIIEGERRNGVEGIMSQKIFMDVLTKRTTNTSDSTENSKSTANLGAGLSDKGGTGLSDKSGAGLGDKSGAGLGDKGGAGLGDKNGAGLIDKGGAGLGDKGGAGLGDKGGAAEMVVTPSSVHYTIDMTKGEADYMGNLTGSNAKLSESSTQTGNEMTTGAGFSDKSGAGFGDKGGAAGMGVTPSTVHYTIDMAKCEADYMGNLTGSNAKLGESSTQTGNEITTVPTISMTDITIISTPDTATVSTESIIIPTTESTIIATTESTVIPTIEFNIPTTESTIIPGTDSSAMYAYAPSSAIAPAMENSITFAVTIAPCLSNFIPAPSASEIAYGLFPPVPESPTLKANPIEGNPIEGNPIEGNPTQTQLNPTQMANSAVSCALL